jgi:hypothetical protein
MVCHPNIPGGVEFIPILSEELPMIESIKQFFSALVSDTALNRVYDARKLSRPEDGGRTSVNLSVGIGMLFLVVTALVAAGWVPRTVEDFINNTEGLNAITEQDVSWSVSDAQSELCNSDTSCRRLITQNLESLSNVPQSTIDQLSNVNSHNRVQHIVQLKIAPSAWSQLSSQRTVVFSLPRFTYLEAEIFFDEKRQKSFAESERMNFILGTENLKNLQQLTINIIFTLAPGQRNLGGVRNGEPPLFATQDAYERLIIHLNSHRQSSSGAIGLVTKVAIAAFCLMLFIMIDSSPESLGLALFMGFEAIAMALGRNWIPLQMIPGLSLASGHEQAIIHFCYQMGDLMKLYFLLQISRVAHKGTIGWLLIGGLISIPYGLFMQAAPKLELSWVYLIPLSRDTIVGTIGMIVCYRSAWHIRNRNLPWRTTALLIAGTAACGEVIASHIAHSPTITMNPAIQTVYTLVQANIGYLFAVSTFINISTLENRVRSLSKAQAEMLEVERELEIGRHVQQSLLSNPRLPEGVAISCQQVAARYVSGDTYFTDWDNHNKVFTFILTDVTGHGIQAALKASACNIIAKTIWSDTLKQNIRILPGSRLLEFDRLSRELLVENGTIPDFQSLIAAEFHTESNQLYVYRSNYIFPVVLSPKSEDLSVAHVGGRWRVEPLIVANKTMTHINLAKGSFVLFMSDGLVDSSRDFRKIILHLRRALADRSSPLDAKQLSKITFELEDFKNRPMNDDQTLLIFESVKSENAKTLTQKSASF